MPFCIRPARRDTAAHCNYASGALLFRHLAYTLLTFWGRIDPALKDRLPQPADHHSNHISQQQQQQYPDPGLAAQQFAQSATSATSNGVSGRTGAQVLPGPSHGYGGSQVGEQEHIHPELRSLRESTTGQIAGPAPTPTMMQAGVPPHNEGGVMGGPPHPSSSLSPSMESGDMGDVVMADGRKAKRELSQSKRAAQNRAAQVSHSCLCPFSSLSAPTQPGQTLPISGRPRAVFAISIWPVGFCHRLMIQCKCASNHPIPRAYLAHFGAVASAGDMSKE
jgi:hypothetical protein